MSSVASQVAKFCTDNCFNSPASIQNISAAHALKSRGASRNEAIIVCFSRRSVRNDVYYAKMKLKDYRTLEGSTVYVNEDLTTITRKIFGAARQKLCDKRIASVWTKSGRVYYKVHSQMLTLAVFARCKKLQLFNNGWLFAAYKFNAFCAFLMR